VDGALARGQSSCSRETMVIDPAEAESKLDEAATAHGAISSG
jgi:hypothetical protein